MSVDAQTKSLRDETFAAHQRFSLKNEVRPSEILSVATWVKRNVRTGLLKTFQAKLAVSIKNTLLFSETLV